MKERRLSRGRALRHSRLQLALAVAAIAAAVSLPVVLISVGGGVSAHELANLQSAGSQIVVSTSGLHSIAQSHTLAQQILRIGSVTAASPILSVAIDAFNATGSVDPVLAEGVIPAEFLPTVSPVERALFPSPLPLGEPTDLVHFDNGTYGGPANYSVIISTPYAQHANLTVGDRILLAPSPNPALGVEYNITGVFGVPPTVIGPTGAFAVMLPLSDLQVLTGYGPAATSPVPDGSDTIQVSVTGAAATHPAALQNVVDAIQQLVPKYSVSTLSQQVQQLEAASGVLTGFYVALSSVGLTIGLLFLALVLLRRVESDRRSIGIRRAIGLPGRMIASEILRAGLAISVAGALIGILVGWAVVEGLATWATSTVQEAAQLAIFSPVVLTEIALGVAGLSLLAGALAARSALRLEIGEALR